MAAENIAMGWRADKKGLVLVFTSIRWLRLKGVPLSSLLLSKQAHLWCRNNQLLTGKNRLCFCFTPSERNRDSQDAALGALPQPKSWARVGVPCSAGSSWTSRRSSAEPSGGYTKWQPLCWHGYRKGSSLGCCHPLQSTRKWWTSGFSRAVQPQPASHRLCKLTVTAELTLPSDGLVSTLHSNYAPKSLTTSILGPNSFWDSFFDSNKDTICHSRKGKHIRTQSRGQQDHTSQDTVRLHISNMPTL